MLVAAVVLGILVSLQWSARQVQRTASLDQVDQTVRLLELEQAELKRRVGRLRDALYAQQQQAADHTEPFSELRAELIVEKTRAGLVDVRGPGVQITLDDSSRVLWGDASDGLVHDFDLRDVINVLWLAGAEAIAVNDERIVHSTSIYCVGATIMVNDTRLSPPYRVSAIGDAVRIQDYLSNPGYLSELKMRSERFGVSLEFWPVEAMTVPAYQGSILQRFAQPGS
jgi:uncharacterized protein YlxW (UPF0749 family)